MSEATTAEPTKAPAEKPTPRPMLISKTLVVKVTATPPEGSPWGPYTASVQPFNRAERRAYFAQTKSFLGDDGRILDAEGYAAKLLDILLPRIKEWDAQLIPGQVAEINKGTVEGLPDFAFDEFLSAALGSAGTLVGN